MKIIETVKINGIYPMFKDGVEATSIQLVSFEFENGDECGFKIVTQKGLYSIGSKAIYIQPDYCLPNDVSLFNSFTAPGGDQKKTRLGKNNRIRAIKFNFTESVDSFDVIYSNGILLPIDEVLSFLNVETLKDLDLAEILNVTKYSEPETFIPGEAIREFPKDYYKTDEDNINNIVSKVKKIIEDNNGELEFGLTVKEDGSSFSMFTEKDENGNFTNTICARQMVKVDQPIILYYKNDIEEFHKYFDKETKTLKWRGKETHTIVDDVENLTPIYGENTDPWISLAKKSGLYDKALEYCKKHDIELGFRGEIFGQGVSKGSGNKLNSNSKDVPTLRLFGIDKLEYGRSIRQHQGDEHNLVKVGEELNLDYTKIYYCRPKTYNELIEFAKSIFAKYKSEHNRVIEGVVCRTVYSNLISTKIMNDEYDANK